MSGSPITTWTAAAQAIGVSVWTIQRRRREAGDKSRPYFVDVDSARLWYARLVNAPQPVPMAIPRPSSTPRMVPRSAGPGLTVADMRAAGRGRRKGGAK